MTSKRRSERSLRRQQIQHDDQARASRTVWVGSIPDPSASEQGVRALLRRCGDVASVHVRRKPGGAKNWCLVMFRSPDDAKATCNEAYRFNRGASATVGWDVRMVDPSKLRSLEAHFTATGVQVDYALEANATKQSQKNKISDGIRLPELTSGFKPQPPSAPKVKQDNVPNKSGRQLGLAEKLDQYQSQRHQMDELRAQDAISNQKLRGDKRRNVDHQVAARAWNCLQLDETERVGAPMSDLLRWAKNVDLFRGLTKKDLTRILRNAKWQIAKVGETLVSLGAACTQLYVVVSGELQVSLPEVHTHLDTNEAAQRVVDGIKSSLAKKKLDALGLMRNDSHSQHKLWSMQVAKRLGTKWKAKTLQRVAKAREALQVPIAIGPTEHVCRDKCISECQRLLDTDSDNPAVATAAVKVGPRSANTAVRVTQTSRLMVLDNMKDVVTIGHAVTATQEENFERLYRFNGFEKCGCDAMRALAQKLSLRKLKHGETIFAQGDPVVHHYFVVSGRVSCSQKRDDGMRNAVGDVSVGGVLGPFPDVQEKRLATAVTAGETEVLVVHTYDLKKAFSDQHINFVDSIDLLLASPITAAKSKLLHREGKDNEATTNGHADVEEDSDTSLKRRNKMQVAAPDTVMQRGLGYSKAAHYATINRTDVAGAQEKAKNSVSRFGLETNWGSASFKERKQSELRSPREPGGAGAAAAPTGPVKKRATFEPTPRLPAIESGRGAR